jgi:hypothetical protein
MYILIFKFYTADEETEVSGLSGRKYYPNSICVNFLKYEIVICYCRSQMFEICHVFQRNYLLSICYYLSMHSGVKRSTYS